MGTGLWDKAETSSVQSFCHKEERVKSSYSGPKEKMANYFNYFNCCTNSNFNCCTSPNWVDVKASEGIEGVDEEEGGRKVVVNHPGGQV